MTPSIRLLAAQINSMRVGHRMVIQRRMLGDLPRHPILDKSGWDLVLDNVIGSAHDDLWSFETNRLTGDKIITRLAGG